MVMGWFRRNQKVIMAVLVGVIMVSWGALPALRFLVARAPAPLGEIRGEPVTSRDLYAASVQLEKCLRYRLLRPDSRLGQFLFGGQPGDARMGRVTSNAAWRYLVLLREAEAAGMQVTTNDLEMFFTFTGLPAQDSELRRGVANLHKILRLADYREESTHVGEPELWLRYQHTDRKAKARLVELKPDLLVPQVDATEEEVRAFYEEHKDLQPDLRAGTPGYQAPERVKLEYALARVEDFKETVSVSDEEITAYYGDHREEFEPPEQQQEEGEAEAAEEEAPEGEGGGEGEAIREPEQSDQDGRGEGGRIERQQEDAPPEEPAVEEGQAGAEAADDGGDAAAASDQEPGNDTPSELEPEPAKTPQEQEPEPPPHVRDVIRERLIAQKAREAAQEQMEKVLDDLQEVAASYVNEPSPLEQMARRHGLHYELAHTESGDVLLSSDDIRTCVPGGAQAAYRVFTEGLEVNFPSFLQTQEGPMVIQVLERRGPEARPFEEVRDRVRDDVLRIKALAKARVVAEQLKERAEASSLEEATREIAGRLARLLGLPKPEPGPQPSEAEATGAVEAAEDQANPAQEPEGTEAGGEAEKETGPEPILVVRETGFISRNSTYVPLLRRLRPALVRELFRLAPGELSVVVEEGADPACYVVQKLAEEPADPEVFHERSEMRLGYTTYRKRQEAVREWMEALLEHSPPPQSMEE